MRPITIMLVLTTLYGVTVVALVASPVMASGVPSLINYQGRLTDGSGNIVADGSYDLAFKIYDVPAGGSPLWSETLPLQITGGLFTVRVGGGTPIPANLFSSSANRYLGVTVNLDPEMPRIQLSSVAYAYQAQDADVATLAQDLTCTGCVSAGEVDATQVQLRVSGTAPPGEYIIGVNQNGTVTTAPDAINVYTAGTGLALNGTQFAIPPDGVTSTEIAADAVGASEIATGAVVGGLGGDIADATITADDLGTNSVGADEIATGAVVGGIGGDILDGTISTDDIQDNIISAVDIAADAVGASEIGTDAVGEDEIAGGAVTSAEILDGTVRFSDIGQNGAVGNQVIKWSGTAWVAGTDDVGAGGGGGDITGVSPGTGLTGGGLSGDVTLGIALGGVTRDEILDGTVGAPDLGTSSVDTDEIAAGAVVGGLGGDVADGTLTADDLGTNSVGSDEIAAAAVVGGLAGDVADGTLTADDLGTNSVGSDEIATGAVGSAEIAADAVGASQIALGAVGSAEVADNSLFGTDIADGTLTADDLGIGSVGSDEIATDAVGSAEIAFAAVGAAEIATDAVGVSEIFVGAVGTSEVLDGSLTAVDIDDEPGVANIIEGAILTMDGTVQTLLSRAIVAPEPGFVLAIATALVHAVHSTGLSSNAQFGVSTTAGVIPSDQGFFVTVAASNPSDDYYQTVTVHGLFSTSGGSDSFFFLGDEVVFGEFTVSDMQLTLIYFPTAYGTVVATTAAASAGETMSSESVVTPPKGAETGLVLPETGSKAAQAQAPDPVSMQRELAEVKARMQKIEEQLSLNQTGTEEKR